MICDALRDLVAFVQFKTRVKHPCRSINFSKASHMRGLAPLSLASYFIVFDLIQFMHGCSATLKFGIKKEDNKEKWKRNLMKQNANDTSFNRAKALALLNEVVQK